MKVRLAVMKNIPKLLAKSILIPLGLTAEASVSIYESRESMKKNLVQTPQN